MDKNHIKELIAMVFIISIIGVVIWKIEERSRISDKEETTIDRTDSILMITDKKIDEVVSYKEQADFVVDSLKHTISDGKKKSKFEVENLKTQVESLSKSEENWRNEANNLKAVPAEKKIIYEKRVVVDTIKVEVPVVVQVVDTIRVNDTITWKKSMNRYKQMKK